MLSRLKLYILTLMLTTATVQIRAQLFAVSTDVAWDALSTPNIAFELGTGERTTLLLSGMYCPKMMGNQMKALVLQPEYRYYFGGRPMNHEFVGLGAIFTAYDVDWSKHIYRGEAFGLGATFGYVFSLARRVVVDLHAGFGFIHYSHREFYEGDHYEYFSQEKNSKGWWILPTRIGLSLSYILK